MGNFCACIITTSPQIMPPKRVLPIHTNSITQPLHIVHTGHVSAIFSVSIWECHAHSARCTRSAKFWMSAITQTLLLAPFDKFLVPYLGFPRISQHILPTTCPYAQRVEICRMSFSIPSTQAIFIR